MADLNDVIKVLIAEGIGEGPEGMRRIGEVILNRAAITGQTPEQIVRESGQFTGYKHPGSATRRAMNDPEAVAEATAAWNLALQPGDPTNGANFYHTDSVNPSWDNRMTNKGKYGNHVFFADRPIPPGEIPTVASLTDTVPQNVAPVTPSIDLAQMRRSTAPSRLVADSFAALPGPRSSANLGDQIAMSPIQGGRQTAQPFDAAYDTRTGNMRLLGQPETISSQGLGVGTSQAPVALPRPRPSTPQSASDRARGQTPMTTLTVGGRTPIGLVEPGNLDLNRRTVMNDGNGGYRTENSISIGTDRGEVLIPTVVNGRQLSERDAIAHYERTGENLGTFGTPQAADRYAEMLHQRQEQQYAPKSASSLPELPRPRPQRTASVPELPRPRPRTAPPDLISQSMSRIAAANPARLPEIPAARTMAPSPATQSVDLRQSRLPLPGYSPMPAPPRVTVSTDYTTPQSQIERGAPRIASQSPATRTVASVPVPPAQSLPPLSAPPRMAIPQSFAGMEGGTPRIPDRLPSTPMAGRLAAPPSVTFDPTYSTAEVTGTVGQTVRPNGRVAPVPASTATRDIARNGSWNGNTFTPPQRPITSQELTAAIPALPRPRPNMGMGGVDIVEPLTANGVAAPVPAPRLQRGGIFGNPQILGHDVPLPGVFGLLQNATKAMNNASGPFNNGADNALYNLMRGGDFNTPGAATGQAGGYLFAPRQGGGWINVGRANPSLSPQQTYDAANARSGHNNGTGSGVGGTGSALDRAFGEARNYN